MGAVLEAGSPFPRERPAAQPGTVRDWAGCRDPGAASRGDSGTRKLGQSGLLSPVQLGEQGLLPAPSLQSPQLLCSFSLSGHEELGVGMGVAGAVPQRGTLVPRPRASAVIGWVSDMFGRPS